jgi:2-polyprenyl-6-methoxyphenol hydroxylase-like FAD-dependent oxidoreductase
LTLRSLSADLPAMREETAQCVIAGGGPAGVMLGYLLARAGVRVVVLEKHADFFRDFRGDTVHPSTLQVMAELGLLDVFLARPHQELQFIEGQIGETKLRLANLSGLPTICKFIAFLPQWDFLDFLAQEGRRFPGFRLIMRAEAQRLIEEEGRVAGVIAEVEGAPVAFRGDLVAACDGRDSTIREAAGLAVRDFGSPIDVLWMSLPRRPDDPAAALGRINYGRLFVTIDRGDYWQCAYVIAKGGYEVVRERGLEALRADIARAAPFLSDRVRELSDWEQVKLLTVQVNRLARWWRPGLICLGDAAHAMSPVGGIGINLAVQDAIAAANQLAGPLRSGRPLDSDLAAIEARRSPPTRTTQAVQLFVQNRIIGRVLGQERQIRPALPFRIVAHTPALQRLTARFIGLGVRPEHVRPEIVAASG